MESSNPEIVAAAAATFDDGCDDDVSVNAVALNWLRSEWGGKRAHKNESNNLGIQVEDYCADFHF